MHWFMALLLCGMLCTPQAHATEKAAEQDLDVWFMTYFQQPQPERMVDMIKAVSAKGYLAKPESALPMLAFLTQVFKDNPEAAAQWCPQLAHLPDAERLGIALAYVSSGIPAAQPCITGKLGLTEAMRKHVQQSPRIDPLHRPARTAGDLDLLWGTFFASGASRAVNGIVDILGAADPDAAQGALTEMALAQMAAEWSLHSNAVQFPEVRRILQNRLAKESNPAIRAALQRIWEKLPDPQI